MYKPDYKKCEDQLIKLGFEFYDGMFYKLITEYTLNIRYSLLHGKFYLDYTTNGKCMSNELTFDSYDHLVNFIKPFTIDIE